MFKPTPRSLIHAPMRPILRPLVRSIFARGGSGFSPASVFVGGAKGLWIDPTVRSNGFQDSAGTTAITASGQLIGKWLDSSGNASNVLEATSSARPEYDFGVSGAGIASHFFDGVDDAYATSVFGAGTLSNNMDAFLAVKRGNANPTVAVFQTAGSGANFWGLIQNGQAAVCAQTVGSAWTAFVDGVQVGGTATTSGGQLHTAVSGTTWHILEFRNLDLSAFTAIATGFYNTTYPGNNDQGGLIICPAQSSTVRDQIRRWLGAKVGLSL